MAKRPALGKGLDALIGKKKASVPAEEPVSVPVIDSDDESGESVTLVSLDRIQSSPLQPRRVFREQQLEELMESIAQHGVIQPLIVREVDGQLELIAGERRWRAAQKAKLDEVPVIIRKAEDRDVLEMALIENIQREDLNPIEEAEAYVRLAREFSLRQEDIAEKVGRNRATVANAMRLLDLEEDVQDHLSHGRITVGHAKVLLGLKNGDEQKMATEKVIRQNMTVRDAEKLVSQIQKPTSAPTGGKGADDASSQVNNAIANLEDRLRERLSTRVKIRHADKKGKIEIEYFGNEELDRILEVMGVKTNDF
ncbi:MAG: ParB/RepB/Spo0J family partition protein [Verrucomicrobiota bacterium]